MPVNADVPAIDDSSTRRRADVECGRAKGIGELPMVGVAAVVANAVYHATGVKVRKVPIRIEYLVVYDVTEPSAH